MKEEKITLLVIGFVLVFIPFLINTYSIYRLICLGIGIILIDIALVLGKKINFFLVLYLPILLLIITYSLDYMKTYMLDLKPIFVFENKITDKISIYNSLFYRIYKCDNEYVFDNDYEKSFACNTEEIQNINVNKLLNEPELSYKNYKHEFIKVTGKISKIIGNREIELKEYTELDKSINGHVNFNEASKLIIKNVEMDSNYKIYDYITIVGYLDTYDKDSNTLIMIDGIVEDSDLYDNYNIQVILNSNCLDNPILYTKNYYTKCLNNIYLDYGVDKYELSYALKDGKITFEELVKDADIEIDSMNEENKLYKLEKFKVLACSNKKNYLLSNEEENDYSLCDL